MELTDRVEKLAHEQGVSESEILEEALEKGVKTLWEDYVASKYVDGELDREEAIDLLGRDKVKQVDKELDAVRKDIEWGMNA